MNLKKVGKVFTSKFVGTGPSSYKKRIYRTTVSQRLRNTVVDQRGLRSRTLYRELNKCNFKVLTGSSSSFSVGLPVANAPDVLQPFGLLYYPGC